MVKFLINKRGITLTELVVVMVVLSILASVSMPVYRMTVKRTKEAALRRELRNMRDGIDYYKKLTDEGRVPKEAGGSGYPKSLDMLAQPITVNNSVITPGTQPLPPKIRILRKVPMDPMTGQAEWGMRSNADEPDSTIWGGQDVFDVYSLSEGTALDGTKYKDW